MLYPQTITKILSDTKIAFECPLHLPLPWEEVKKHAENFDRHIRSLLGRDFYVRSHPKFNKAKEEATVKLTGIINPCSLGRNGRLVVVVGYSADIEPYRDDILEALSRQ